MHSRWGGLLKPKISNGTTYNLLDTYSTSAKRKKGGPLLKYHPTDSKSRCSSIHQSEVRYNHILDHVCIRHDTVHLAKARLACSLQAWGLHPTLCVRAQSLIDEDMSGLALIHGPLAYIMSRGVKEGAAGGCKKDHLRDGCQLNIKQHVVFERAWRSHLLVAVSSS